MRFKSDIVIGLEIHVELDTDTKLFCGCPKEPKKVTKDEEPNSRTCPVCLGMPGSKPVLNKKAVEHAMKLALALNCRIAKKLVFSRKSYFYPDMAKNYQITQYEIPLGETGSLALKDGKKIGITRVHIEEDPAALVHPSGIGKGNHVLVDYNRSGNPLVEIVTEPELESPEQARDFMKQLITILGYLEIHHLGVGLIKADANVSIKESGYVRSEIKNVTGFKEIERALFYEVERQKKAVEEKRDEDEKLIQDTRAWDAKKGVSFRIRTKETEEDYGYILDPDLVEIELDPIRKELEIPEMASEKAKRFVKKYNIKEEDAHILAAEKSLAELFEKAAQEIDPKLAANWLRHQLNRFLNSAGKNFKEIEADEKDIIELLGLVEAKKITDQNAKEILEKLIEKPFSINDYVNKKGLAVISDKSKIEELCKKSIKENPKAVEDYLKGEEKSLNFLVGKVMAATKGKAAASEVSSVIKQLIKKNKQKK